MAIFGRDMMIDVPFPADLSKIGEHRQIQMYKNTARENSSILDAGYQPSDRVLVTKYDGILCKSKSPYVSVLWTILSVYTNDTIMIHSK